MKPWKNQTEEADMISSRPFCYIGAEMGTGKTGAAILGVVSMDAVLVVCPIAVGPAWVKHFEAWDPARHVVLAVDGPSAKRSDAIRAVPEGSRYAVIVNYDAMWRGKLGEVIKQTKWGAIVLDESHKIKSPSGRASKFVAKLAKEQPSATRVCLSGTPTPHSPLDWWSQFRFLDEGVLGKSYTAFRSRIADTHPRFPGMITRFKTDALEALTRRIDEHVYRIRMDDVLDLPPMVHTELPVVLDRPSLKFYRELEEELTAVLETGERVTAANKLSVITRLQQATSGYTVDEQGNEIKTSTRNAKSEVFREWLENLPADEPLVVFCRFIRDIDECMRVLAETGRTVGELSGRKKELASWQNGDTLSLVVQQQAGGVGVDCTRACYACYYSLSHSLGDYEQSLARLRRPGQTRTTRIYHLVSQKTIDTTIYKSLQSKRDVVEEVLLRLTRRAAT